MSVLPPITIPPVIKLSPTTPVTISYVTTVEQIPATTSGTTSWLSTVPITPPPTTLPAISVPALTTRQTVVIPSNSPSRSIVIPPIAGSSPQAITLPQAITVIPSVPRFSPKPSTAALASAIPSTLPKVIADVDLSPSNLSTPRLEPTKAELMEKTPVEMTKSDFEIRDYSGVISKASIENELLSAGYGPLSKVIIKGGNGQKQTQYIKAVNKKGQKVFVIIDVDGFTTSRATDLTLIESSNASIVPYSVKTGAYNCADKDVCGVAFECGADAICTLVRDSDDLSPKEATFVFSEQHAPATATLLDDGNIISYPVVRLSEIRANPDLVLANTDLVTRRLRNSAYLSGVDELVMTQKAINNLALAFDRFNGIRERSALKLNTTLTQLEKYNDAYLANPPTTDEYKTKYRQLQYNLLYRNDGISSLIRSMKRIADKYRQIDELAKEINDIADYCDKEFASLDSALTE